MCRGSGWGFVWSSFRVSVRVEGRVVIRFRVKTSVRVRSGFQLGVTVRVSLVLCLVWD